MLPSDEGWVKYSTNYNEAIITNGKAQGTANGGQHCKHDKKSTTVTGTVERIIRPYTQSDSAVDTMAENRGPHRPIGCANATGPLVIGLGARNMINWTVHANCRLLLSLTAPICRIHH